MGRKVAFKTLGCRLNQYETEALASQFHREGYKIVDFKEKADAYIVNTCTVTNQSDKKSRNAIHSVPTKKNNSIMVVTGCMTNNHESELNNDDQITYLVKNEHKSSIYSLINAHFKGEIFSQDMMNQNVFNYQPTEQIFHTRSMVKIQDGCDNMCSFCIIPMVRGRAVSRSVDDILDNIRSNVHMGYKEITLTGVNISRYEYHGVDFTTLVERILDLPGDFRVRISSMEPDGLDDRFIELFENPRLCNHLHLCLQSGSDRILLKMRRMYNTESYLQLIHKIKSRYSDFNFTTDIMVGFPGETEEDFNETCAIAREVGFSHIHTFKYSKRDNTRAARMPDQIPEHIKEERSKIIRAISNENKRNYYNSIIGKKQVVIPEKTERGFTKGYGENYVPVKMKSERAIRNEFNKVTITGIDKREFLLIGE